MPRLILVALSEQEGTLELARRIAQLDPQAIVIVTSDLALEFAEPIIQMVNDIRDGVETES